MSKRRHKNYAEVVILIFAPLVFVVWALMELRKPTESVPVKPFVLPRYALAPVVPPNSSYTLSFDEDLRVLNFTFLQRKANVSSVTPSKEQLAIVRQAAQRFKDAINAPQGRFLANIHDGKTIHSVLVNKNRLTVLKGLDGLPAYGSNINESGEVVGTSRTKEGAVHAVVWRTRAPVDLGTFGAYNSYGMSINKQGSVVVALSPFSDRFQKDPRASQFVLWREEQEPQLIEMGEYGTGYPVFFRKDNSIVFRYSLGGGNVIWQDGEFTKLRISSIEYDSNNDDKLLGHSNPDAIVFDSDSDQQQILIPALGVTDSSPISINNKGEVVGTMTVKQKVGLGVPTAFVYLHNTMYDLNTLLNSPFNGHLAVANEIGDKGHIIVAALVNGQARDYLLTPM